MYGRSISRSSTSPVMKVSASQGIVPSSRTILRLSRAHSLSESLNSYCVRWKERRRERVIKERGREVEGGREGGRKGAVVSVISLEHSTTRIPSGMEGDVVPTAHAVCSTLLPGSVSTSLTRQPTISRSECVTMKM